jgi:hypothetical protein
MATTNFTYLFYDVRDYSGRSSLSSYTIDITPLTFVPDFTTSPLLSTENNISNKKIRWDFGDGTYSSDLTAIHIYKWPGKYKPNLTVFDAAGNAFDNTYQPIITIRDFVHDEIRFEVFKRLIYDVPASKLIEPLVVRRYSSWQSWPALSAEGYTINFYASGASGDYLNVSRYYSDKWSHLRLLSRFYGKFKIGDTEQYVVVDKLSTTNVLIYARINDNKQLVLCNKNDPGSFFCGTTGQCEAHYVDDKVKNYTSRENPIIIFASIDNSKFKDFYSTYSNIFDFVLYPPGGFQNINYTTMPIIKVRHNPAQRLSITTNGIDGEGHLSATSFDIPYHSWQNSEIPFVIKFKDNENYTTKTYPPLSSSLTDTRTATGYYDLKFGLCKYSKVFSNETYTPLTGISFYEDFNEETPHTIGGFFKGYLVSPYSVENVVLTGSVLVEDPVNFPKDTLISWIAQPQSRYIGRFFRQQIISSCLGTVGIFLSSQKTNIFVDENRNQYAIACAISGAGVEEDYRPWVADGVADTLLKLNANTGEILSSFDFTSFKTIIDSSGNVAYLNYRSPVLSSAAPNSIALDKNSDIWVSLFDSISTVKVHALSGVITNIAYPHYQNLVYHLSSDYNLPQLSGFAGENTLLPSSVDTDFDNNLWVAYTHPISSLLIKYNTYGSTIKVIPFVPLYSPVEVCVDRNKMVWVTCLNNSTISAFSLSSRNDYLFKYDFNGNLIPQYPLSGFRLIGNICVDGGQNAWVSHDRDTISRIDAYTAQRTDVKVGSANNTSHIQSIDGIICDTSQYIWAINNIDGRIYYVDAFYPPYPINSASLLPGMLDDTSYPISAWEEKRYQAYGDWNGFRWINKYMYSESLVRTITGTSAVFNIYSSNGKYELTKENENFDMTEYYKQITFQDFMLSYNNFLDTFLGTIVGNVSSMPYTLGKTVYEKIANFIDNNGDIDKCNVDSLISFCYELGIQFEDYNYPFPPNLKRLVNLLSLKHNILWGDQNKFNLNFYDKGSVNNSYYAVNRGTELSVLTSKISIGVPIIAYEIFSDTYNLVNESRFTLLSTVPLSSYSNDWGWGLVASDTISGSYIGNYYKFFEFIDKPENTFYNNIINWKDGLTTLSPFNSSYTNWISDKGIVENLFSFYLSKGLNVLE